MQETLFLDAPIEPLIRIGFIGVGGAGGALLEGLTYPFGVPLWYFDADLRALNAYRGDASCHLIGKSVTRGWGAGGCCDLAKSLFEAEHELFVKTFQDLDLVFIFVGLAGSSAAGLPVLLSALKTLGVQAFVLGVAPFSFESEVLKEKAHQHLAAIREAGAIVFVLPNQYLLESLFKHETVLEAFSKVNAWVNRWLQSFLDLWFKKAHRSIGWRDFQALFEGTTGKTLWGMGLGSGQGAGLRAVHDLMLCPFLQAPENARQVDRLIVMVTVSPDISMEEWTETIHALKKAFGGEALLMWGMHIDPTCVETVKISLLGSVILSEKKALSAEVSVPAVANRKKNKMRSVGQGEFDFSKSLDQRGFFGKTQGTIYKGEDLDIPTYIRKNIKIN